MFDRRVLIVVVGLVAGGTVVAQSVSGGGSDAVPAHDPADSPTAFDAYQAHLAANDAAADRWRAEHGTGDATLDVAAHDDQGTVDNGGCPEGTQHWRRDRITELCAPLCAGDQDCGPEEGRCRILDVADTSSELPVVLVDELPPDEVDDWMAGADPQSPPVMVCDPFWDVAGALDADLIDAVPVTADE